jgi:hypothetical protein
MKSIKNLWRTFAAEHENCLSVCAGEILSWQNTGRLADGLCRAFSQRLLDKGYPEESVLMLVERQVATAAMEAVQKPQWVQK